MVEILKCDEPALERRPHRRRNPLTGEWLLVSPQRTERPWLGQEEPRPAQDLPAYDPTCYLCPGNRRARGETNPHYPSTFVFENDFSALTPFGPSSAPAGAHGIDPLLSSEEVQGTCHVLCFSPRHDLTLAKMDEASLTAVVDLWAAETASLGARYRWVQVFENKGTTMGCSNPHPHGQVWATSVLPTEAEKEDRCQRDYFAQRGSSLLVDYARRELEMRVRVLCDAPDWLALVPYWATWPFETLIVAKRPVARLPDLSPDERVGLARVLHSLLKAYDDLFGVSFPYSMGWHGAPYTPEANGHWQLHAHVYPPLLRSATVRKYMVGYEMLAEPQRDLTPERAAERLREVISNRGRRVP